MIRTHFYHRQRTHLMAAALFFLVAGLSHTALAKHRHKSSSSGREQPLTGNASWYGKDFHGRRTASGETYNMNAYTAAHRSLPFGVTVRVTNLNNGKSVIVKINDRGPHVGGRIIDLSYAAAKKIGVHQSGVARVRLEVVDPGLYAIQLAEEESQPEGYELADRDELTQLIRNSNEPPPPAYMEVGYASLFGKKSVLGEPINMDELAAAHGSLPFGTKLKVTNLNNGKSVIVKINHRCNSVLGRIIQITRATARELDMTARLVAKVKIEVVQ